ncbi:MAG TPA: rod shape-determining protein MreC [Ruminococcaceae bacterium]|nr:rod shape-determining protein MreC [Oscillospiraceae bacterium]
MRFFFRSRQFKIIAAVFAALIVIAAVTAAVGGRMSPGANIFGTVTAPFRSLASKISGGISSFVEVYTEGEKLNIKNAELETEISELRKKLADYEQAVSENEFYKNYLDIKDANPSFKFMAATLISRDKEDPYKGFIINKGSVNGVSAHDPVITNEGLVGYIGEVGLTTSKVVTVLSAELTAGALDNRTSDSGVLSGSAELASEGLTKFYNLSRSCNIAVGDYVVTSGEGIFPKGLLIGTVQTIGSDKYNTSIYANVKPFADIDGIRGVMVITEFEGQGGLDPEKSK